MIESYESKEEEEAEDKSIEKMTKKFKTTLGEKPWKPKVENLDVQIIENKDFVQLKKYYHLYNNMDIMQLEKVAVRHMILEKKIFEDI